MAAMADIIGFEKRFTGPNHIAWSAEDIERLRKMYGLSKAQAQEIIRKARPTLMPPSVGKLAPSEDMPTKWRFVASDGKYDQVNDLVAVDGISLREFNANPIWHWMHDFSLPIGRGLDTEKREGQLLSTLELGLGVYPY